VGAARLAAHQKKAKRRNAHIVFIDESGFSLIPNVRKSWAPVGRTPVAYHPARHWRKVSAIGAISISPRRRRLGLYLATHPGRDIRQAQVIRFLRDLSRHLRGPIIIIWDNLNVHRGREVRKWIDKRRRIELEFLPPYAPELNPVEGLWNNTKNHHLANHCLEQLEDLEARVQEHADAVGNQRVLLSGFIRQTRLPLRLWLPNMHYQRSA